MYVIKKVEEEKLKAKAEEKKKGGDEKAQKKAKKNAKAEVVGIKFGKGTRKLFDYLLQL